MACEFIVSRLPHISFLQRWFCHISIFTCRLRPQGLIILVSHDNNHICIVFQALPFAHLTQYRSSRNSKPKIVLFAISMLLLIFLLSWAFYRGQVEMVVTWSLTLCDTVVIMWSLTDDLIFSGRGVMYQSISPWSLPHLISVNEPREALLLKEGSLMMTSPGRDHVPVDYREGGHSL